MTVILHRLTSWLGRTRRIVITARRREVTRFAVSLAPIAIVFRKASQRVRRLMEGGTTCLDAGAAPRGRKINTPNWLKPPVEHYDLTHPSVLFQRQQDNLGKSQELFAICHSVRLPPSVYQFWGMEKVSRRMGVTQFRSGLIIPTSQKSAGHQ